MLPGSPYGRPRRAGTRSARLAYRTQNAPGKGNSIGLSREPGFGKKDAHARDGSRAPGRSPRQARTLPPICSAAWLLRWPPDATPNCVICVRPHHSPSGDSLIYNMTETSPIGASAPHRSG